MNHKVMEVSCEVEKKDSGIEASVRPILLPEELHEDEMQISAEIYRSSKGYMTFIPIYYLTEPMIS